MQPPLPPRGQWRQRAMNIIGRVENISFPKWLSTYSIVTYVLALLVVTFMYSDYSMPWYYMLSGMVAVLVFFLYGSHLTNDKLSLDRIHRAKTFEKRIFIIAFIPRLLFMLLLYYLFTKYYGDSFGFENMDAVAYDELGQFVAGMIERGDYHFYDAISKWSGNKDIADMGYGVYVGFIYWLTGSTGVVTSSGLGGTNGSIIAVRILKCIWSSITVVLVYRLARRNFGDRTARVAAIFCALWPNFWYYCANHLKETEMAFLVVLYVEQADQMLRSRQFTAWKIVPILLIASAIFTFRTPLGLVALLALVFSVVMSSTKVVSWGKRIIVGFIAVALIGIIAGERIQERADALYTQVQENSQQKNMEWRTRREHGNTFAKYASSAVFAPMIFTIPFPTMIQPYEGQDVQQLLNGGNFVKNIMSCFAIFSLFLLLLSGRWREHLLPLSFLLGYLFVLTMSQFAQSERFYQPVMPFEFMFASYGLSVAVTKKKYKRWFTYWCVLMFIAAIAWSWFKLAGRGLA